MATRKNSLRLTKKLEALQKQDGGTIKIESIAGVVEETVNAVIEKVSAKDHELSAELQLLSKYIDDAKAEISSLRPDDVKTEFLPSASNELDAIVEATEVATHEIMDATDMIGEAADEIGGTQGDLLMDATMRIYQACGFQDITGQRITKIVTALKHIEVKIDALADAFGDVPKKKKKKKAAPKKSAKKTDKKTAAKKSNTTRKKSDKSKVQSDADLLEGPQLPGDAIKQDEVDALLASFD